MPSLQLTPHQVFIFDFDGTLANTLDLMRTAFNGMALEYGLPKILPDNLPQLRAMSAKELLQKYPLSPLTFLKLRHTIQDAVRSNIQNCNSVDGIPLVLKQLKKSGAIIGIVTSNSKENVQLFFEQNRSRQIDFIYSEKNLFGKAKVLNKIIREKGFSKTSVVYIGDEVRDIEAAHQAGVTSVAVTWGFNTRERLLKAQPEYVVDEPGEILEILKHSVKSKDD